MIRQIIKKIFFRQQKTRSVAKKRLLMLGMSRKEVRLLLKYSKEDRILLNISCLLDEVQCFIKKQINLSTYSDYRYRYGLVKDQRLIDLANSVSRLSECYDVQITRFITEEGAWSHSDPYAGYESESKGERTIDSISAEHKSMSYVGWFDEFKSWQDGSYIGSGGSLIEGHDYKKYYVFAEIGLKEGSE